jgi:hypothetical protein
MWVCGKASDNEASSKENDFGGEKPEDSRQQVGKKR